MQDDLHRARVIDRNRQILYPWMGDIGPDRHVLHGSGRGTARVRQRPHSSHQPMEWSAVRAWWTEGFRNCLSAGFRLPERVMGYDVRGKLHKMFDAKQITERFRKREFVVELADNPRYPQYVLFQLTGDRCEILDPFKVGDEVQLEFSLRGREWTSPQDEVKYFNSLDVWNVDKRAAGAKKTGGGKKANDDAAPPSDDEPPHPADSMTEDDVPF